MLVMLTLLLLCLLCAQAITLSAESLRDVSLTKERVELSRFFTEVARDSGLYCYGPADTMEAVDRGAVDTLLVWDSLQVRDHIMRVTYSIVSTVMASSRCHYCRCSICHMGYML